MPYRLAYYGDFATRLAESQFTANEVCNPGWIILKKALFLLQFRGTEHRSF
jgi:hypothetical protein